MSWIETYEGCLVNVDKIFQISIRHSCKIEGHFEIVASSEDGYDIAPIGIFKKEEEAVKTLEKIVSTNADLQGFTPYPGG